MASAKRHTKEHKVHTKVHKESQVTSCSTESEERGGGRKGHDANRRGRTARERARRRFRSARGHTKASPRHGRNDSLGSLQNLFAHAAPKGLWPPCHDRLRC